MVRHKFEYDGIRLEGSRSQKYIGINLVIDGHTEIELDKDDVWDLLCILQTVFNKMIYPEELSMPKRNHQIVKEKVEK